MTTIRTQTRERHFVKAGVTGGLVGGIFFGFLLAGLGLLPVIAELVGSRSVIIGFTVHMAISALFGALFGLGLEFGLVRLSRAVRYGALYGVFWWVVGALTLMPLFLGLEPQLHRALAPSNLIGLLGHVIYGVVLGATVVTICRSKWGR